jgi:hypothetical protein
VLLSIMVSHFPDLGSRGMPPILISDFQNTLHGSGSRDIGADKEKTTLNNNIPYFLHSVSNDHKA